MRRLVLVVVLLLLISFAIAQENLKPVLYGQATDGLDAANGAIITVYPEADPTDIITDTVGASGNTALSGYWKVNLYNLDKRL